MSLEREATLTETHLGTSFCGKTLTHAVVCVLNELVATQWCVVWLHCRVKDFDNGLMVNVSLVRPLCSSRTIVIKTSPYRTNAAIKRVAQTRPKRTRSVENVGVFVFLCSMTAASWPRHNDTVGQKTSQPQNAAQIRYGCVPTSQSCSHHRAVITQYTRKHARTAWCQRTAQHAIKEDEMKLLLPPAEEPASSHTSTLGSA